MKKFTFFLLLLILIFYNSSLLAQWIQTNGPSGVSDFAVSNANLFAGGGSIGVYISTDQGNTWTDINSGLADSSVSCLAVSETNLYVGTPSGIYMSTDNGFSWTALDTVILNYVQDIAISSTNLFAGTLFGVFLSTDNGTSWTAVNNGLTETFVIDLAVNGPNLFAATQNGVFLSTNNGANWTSAGLENYSVHLLTISNNNVFAASAGAGVYVSTDNGTSWSISDSGLTEQSILDFEVYKTSVFASTLNFVFLTMNNGESWTAVNDGLTAFYFSALGVDESNLFAGTMGSGVWCRPLSEMITDVENEISEIPAEFALEQNYPNPFNSSSVIKYSIPKSSQVSIKIFNTLGEEIETLVNKEITIGTYEVNWNAVNLPSGVYFYRLQAGEFIQIKKTILLK